MDRDAMHILKTWKQKGGRKPLIIRGARQVGKTWLMKAFGKQEYASTAYVNFERSASLARVFQGDYDISRIIEALQIETDVQIIAGETLIILDEIQEAEGAITSLKYFQENCPEYHVIAAGSFLGVAMHSGYSFPVGKVEFLDLYPLTYTEFLHALGQESLVSLLHRQDYDMISGFREKFIQLLRTYYYTGGMPEVVATYRETKDMQAVREIQKRILRAYENDFSKHVPSAINARVRMLWNSILSQLAKENRKFIYSAVKTGSRAKDYELALSWLIDSGMIYKVSRVSKPGMPLKAYEDLSAFKLFHFDVGLLAAMGDIDARSLLEGNRIFEEFKGALTEQYVLQQMKADKELVVYYWSADRSSAEIDFLIQHHGRIVPVEVKAEENLRAKSLKAFCQKYIPETAIRTSMSDYRKEDWMVNLPLYAIDGLGRME